MKIRAALLLLALFGMTITSFSANAAGTKPILKVDCGHLLTLTDKDGEFVYFNPTVAVSYWGKYLNYWVYQSPQENVALKDRSVRYGTETRSKASAYTFGTSTFDWSQQLRYEYVDSPYLEIYMIVKDSLKRTTTMKCIWKKN